jgi:NAD+ synthase
MKLEKYMVKFLNMKKEIINWIKDYASTDFKLVVGVSGGIDSAVVSTLCAMTEIETHVLSMPIQQEKNQLQRAMNHIYWLENNHSNVISHHYDLTDVFDCFKLKFEKPFNSEHSFANSKSRIRMLTLYQVASSINGLVVGTGNKIEDFGIGFYTKYGDGGVDISPIADLTKSEVRELAKILNINKEIIDAKPTDGLWSDNRTDEDQIGATYEELEWAMSFLSENKDFKIEKLSNRELEILNIYKKHNSKNKHKMLPIPIYKK